MKDTMAKIDFGTLQGRTRWAIDYIVNKNHLSNSRLAEKMNVSTGAINNYRRMTTVPNVEFVLRFCELFNFSILWFVQGTGYPFPGAKESHPEAKGPYDHPKPPDIPGVFGKDADKPFIPLQRVEVVTRADADHDPETKISDLIQKTIVVLESKTIFTQALRSNIEAFHHSVTTEGKLVEFERIIGRQNELIEQQNAKLVEMERKINYLTDLQQGQSAGAA